MPTFLFAHQNFCFSISFLGEIFCLTDMFLGGNLSCQNLFFWAFLFFYNKQQICGILNKLRVYWNNSEI